MLTLQKQLLTHLLHSNNNKNNNIQLIQVERSFGSRNQETIAGDCRLIHLLIQKR